MSDDVKNKQKQSDNQLNPAVIGGIFATGLVLGWIAKQSFDNGNLDGAFDKIGLGKKQPNIENKPTTDGQ